MTTMMRMNATLVQQVTEMALQNGLGKPSSNIGNPAVWDIPVISYNNDSTGTTAPITTGTIRVGNILGLIPASVVDGGGGNGNKLADSTMIGISVTAYLAVQDFNNRASPFWQTVQQHEEQLKLLDGCEDFYLSISYRDNEMSAIMTGQRWMEEFFSTASSETQVLPSFAVLGTIRSTTATTAASLGAVTGHVDVETGENVVGIPNISPTATSSKLDQKGEYPYFGRTVPNNGGEAEALCFFLQSLGVHQFAILYVNDNFGTAYMESVVEAARSDQYGNMQVTIASYHDYDEQSLHNAVAQLQAVNLPYALAILPAGFWRETIVAMYQAGLMSSEHQWFFSEALIPGQGTVLDVENNEQDAIVAKAINRTAGISLREYEHEAQILARRQLDFAKNPQAIQQYLDAHKSGFLAGANTSNHEVFRQHLQSASWPNPSNYPLFAYDAIWALGLAACQGTQRNQASGPQIFESLKQLQFLGASGNVSFDLTTGTRDSAQMNYQVVNLMTMPTETFSSTLKITPVYSTEINLGQGRLTVERPLIYADGTTSVPAPARFVQPELNLVPNSVRAVCWSLAALVIMCSLYLVVWTHRRQGNARIRASQPIFLIILCIGTFFMGCSIIFLTLQEPVSQNVLNASCMTQIWLLSFGFTTTFAALFAKTWRIHRLVQSARSFRRIRIKASDVKWPFIVVFSLNLSVLTAWTVLDPFQWVRLPMATDQFGSVVESRGTCMAQVPINHAHDDNEDGHSASITHLGDVFFWLLIAIDGIAFLISGIQSYRTRNLPSEFNESAYLWMSNFIILESLIISIPVLYLVDKDPTAQMISQSLIATVFALGVLGPMFLPKMSRGATGDNRHVRSSLGSMYLSRQEGVPPPEVASSTLGSAMRQILDFVVDVVTAGARRDQQDGTARRG